MVKYPITRKHSCVIQSTSQVTYIVCDYRFSLEIPEWTLNFISFQLMEMNQQILSFTSSVFLLFPLPVHLTSKTSTHTHQFESHFLVFLIQLLKESTILVLITILLFSVGPVGFIFSTRLLP